METKVVIMSGPKAISTGTAGLTDPGPTDLVVDIAYSGISTGTEKLFWLGTMPPFPGMGYPLVPGYESFGEVVEAAPDTGFRPGDHVFVPGANCFSGGVRGLFGGASKRLVTASSRVCRLDAGMGAEGALLALAATARHALAGFDNALPDLIVGHGTLGRLLARLTIAAGGKPPMVWETNPARRSGAVGYEVLDPEDDPRRDYMAIYDASGAPGLIDQLVGRIAKGGELVLCGFYTVPVSFAFVPAFMKEMRLRIAAEWQPADLSATRALIESGALSLDGLITHRRPATEAAEAYQTAFEDPDCLKMILDWRDVA
ncbi:2-desacetyl-2-hydroxyethyl bacteriochlorophyllide A dehydrogenase [Rhodobacter aestuarii]|uniref:3-hydroxyethyl bacteriochlorophyllide a dehydrogenase n=1 Tax=Rhodobacter aestuarii TaxID=453582 RepID=A0A1N7MKI0_9RHOB|nr:MULTISPECIES: chlorophyll synthesis pathway protein BchC [Rhodobacter]MBZ4022338.1 chlorophyll synthesis pathway protein BchC [Rhodobacter sp. TJ_12]PTV96705.1 2-desacetyl-2-hydroxyethyl bacteriochlorophyllide A dehydrogenase [Rhodobacter aestuarii]SIS86439.1 3-hydroxyethyl bacteriochlorophyllide a dehydrogenase [Rhodobacter aestuarii]SOB90680.1 2-desacetyl-2-hydroxyethyl bacteriochlorophyllide A dehydrogenase [Rhodobacter sp. JA431]